MTDKPRRGRPPKVKKDDLKNITIRVEITDSELVDVNLRTTPRQRALLLAQLAKAIQEIEAKKVEDVANEFMGMKNPLKGIGNFAKHQGGFEMETTYNQINLKEWKTVNSWNNGESTYSEYDAKQRAEQHTEWLADLEAAGATGWHELEVSEDDVPSHQHGMEVKVSGNGQYLHIRDVTQAMGMDSETLYRRKPTPDNVGAGNTETIWSSREERTAVLDGEWKERERIERESRERWHDEELAEQRRREWEKYA